MNNYLITGYSRTSEKLATFQYASYTGEFTIHYCVPISIHKHINSIILWDLGPRMVNEIRKVDPETKRFKLYHTNNVIIAARTHNPKHILKNWYLNRTRLICCLITISEIQKFKHLFPATEGI